MIDRAGRRRLLSLPSYHNTLPANVIANWKKSKRKDKKEKDKPRAQR
jgi:hypothetical protein